MRLKQHLGACMALVVATPVVAQRPDSLNGQLAHTVREVTAIHELRDGRALVLDSYERFVYLADVRTGDSKVIGDQGWAERPYVWPSRLPIGTGGELVDRFQLAPDTQIVASGNRAVYVTARGADGRLTLQRFSVRPR